jgi:predicted RNase H-like HicB family nuclease
MKTSITFEVSLPFKIKKEAKYFISHCPPLDVWSQGKTEEKAMSNLIEAVRLFLVDCFERGTLERVLKASGFVAVRKSPKRHKPSSKNEINVPLPFIIDQEMARCHD